MAMANEFEDERQVIEDHWDKNWNLTQTEYENTELENPPGVYVALFIRSGSGDAHTLWTTSPRERFNGFVELQIFVPENEGLAQANRLLSSATAVFRRKTLQKGNSGRIVFRQPIIRKIGDQDGRYQINVSIPYRRDVIYAN